MRILVFQHVDVEHPGVFREFWAENGHEWVPVELDAGEAIPDMDGFDLLVVMGGPMDVWQEDLHPWLVARKGGDPPLGARSRQSRISAFASAISFWPRPSAVRSARWRSPRSALPRSISHPAGQRDPILAGFPPRVESFQWHGAEVSRLPEGAEILAANAACPVQAFRWGRHAYGFQYHCEITAATVAEWERIPAYQASLEQALGVEQANAPWQPRCCPGLPAFRAAARQVNDNLWSILATNPSNVAGDETATFRSNGASNA